MKTGKPFIKWVGGKGQLLGQLQELLPADFNNWKDVTYIEPFVGGGAMLFYMLDMYPNIKRAIINDINPDLTQCYRVVRDKPRELIEALRDIQALKTTSLKTLKDGTVTAQETLAITMIDPYEVSKKCFEESHLYSKLKKMILVSRIVSHKFEDSGIVYSVNTFDLEDAQLLEEIKADYDLIRKHLIANNNDITSLSGKMGKWIQPRTKGSANSKSRAFYARKNLVKRIIGI